MCMCGNKKTWEISVASFQRCCEAKTALENKVFKKQVLAHTATAKSLQLCPTLSDPMDCSLPGSSAHGIFQARVLEWGAIAFST